MKDCITHELFPYLEVILVSIVLVFVFLKHKNRSSVLLPPGTTGFPVIGEMVEYGLSGPEKFIEKRMRKYSREVFRTSLLGEKMVVFCGPAGNKFIFSNENKNMLTRWWPEAFQKPLTFPVPAETTMKDLTNVFRGFLQEFLRPESLKHFVPIMDSMVRKQIETDWVHFEEIKVYPLSKKITFSLACRLFLGMEDMNLVEVLRGYFDLVQSLMISVPINLPGTAYNKAMKLGKIVKNEIVEIIIQRKKEKTDDIEKLDFLSHVLFRSKNTSYQVNDICNMMTSVLLPTYDDTSAAVTFVLKYLAELPHVYNEVYKECKNIASSKGQDELLKWNDIQKMKYSWNVAREMLRLTPPSAGSYRDVTADISFAGFTVPKGWKTFWSVYSTHKDPKYFSDPERFDPSRFEGSGPEPYTFVPFGGGSSICPGREYARLNILVVMYNVVIRFKLEKLDPNEKVKYHITPFPEHGLPVRLIVHG